MILMLANPLQGPLEEVGPENQDFFGPRNSNERSECHFGAQEVLHIIIDTDSAKTNQLPTLRAGGGFSSFI